MLGKRIGMDLGESHVRLFVRGEGIVFREPTAVFNDVSRDGRPVVGSAALQAAAIKESPVRYPLTGGAVTDRQALDALLYQLITRVTGRQRIFKPDVIIAVAAQMSGEDRFLLLDSAARAGARSAFLVDAPFAAALGAGLSVGSAGGQMVVDCGAGTTELAVISHEGIQAVRSLPWGGIALTRAILDEVGEAIDQPIAERLKQEVATAAWDDDVAVPCGGRSGGAERTVTIRRSQLFSALRPYLAQLAAAVGEVVRDAPPTLAGDVRATGMVLTGGGARLGRLDRYLMETTGIRARVAPDADACVIRGLGVALDRTELVRRGVLDGR